jgi:CubicO group peptidase (beta-lactamase class C family)
MRTYSPKNPMKVPHAEAYLANDVVFFDGFGGQRVYIVPSRRLVVARTPTVDFSYDDSVILNGVLRAVGLPN